MNKCPLILKEKTITELKKICKLNDIRGCYGKKKTDLVNHVCKYGLPYKPPRLDRSLMPLNVLLEQLYVDDKPTGYSYDGVNNFITTNDPEEKERLFRHALIKRYIKPIFVNGEKRYKITKKGVETQLPQLKLLMEKKLRKNVLKSFQELAQSGNEYSMALDFERSLENPERILEYRGGKDMTLRIDDFELFGHTHPYRHVSIPSAADLYGMSPFRPEFIIAGLSGETLFLNVENPKKWLKWKKNHPYKTLGHTSAIDRDAWAKKYPDDRVLIHEPDFLKTKIGQKMFFKETGVKILPFKDMIKLSLIRDDVKEKPYFGVGKRQLEKWSEK